MVVTIGSYKHIDYFEWCVKSFYQERSHWAGNNYTGPSYSASPNQYYPIKGNLTDWAHFISSKCHCSFDSIYNQITALVNGSFNDPKHFICSPAENSKTLCCNHLWGKEAGSPLADYGIISVFGDGAAFEAAAIHTHVLKYGIYSVFEGATFLTLFVFSLLSLFL